MQGKKMHGSQIVAHLIDGTIVKGTSLDVDPKRPTCHLRPEAGEAVEIALADVKALFFVKSWSGESGRNDAKQPVTGDSRLLGAKLVRVVFAAREGGSARADTLAPPRPAPPPPPPPLLLHAADRPQEKQHPHAGQRGRHQGDGRGHRLTCASRMARN